MSQKSSKMMFWFMCAVLVSGVLFSLYALQQKPPQFGGDPRNSAPMEEYTKYYTKLEAKVKGGPFGYGLTYYMYAPRKPWPEKLRFPLVLILHGAPGKSYAGKYIITPSMQRAYPAFVVVPVLPPGHFWGHPDGAAPDGSQSVALRMPDVMKLLEEVVAQNPVDVKRIYVIGCSDGGTGAFAAVRYYPNVFAAAVPIAGTWRPSDAKILAKVPMWVMHTENDSIFPVSYTRNLVRAIHASGGNVSYTEIPQMDHNCPYSGFYAPQTWQWMFTQKKK
jgi:predicted peptidase